MASNKIIKFNVRLIIKDNISFQYLLPFLLNQSGSVIYVYVLQTIDLSIAVIVSNSLSFIFTTMSALALGEQKSSMSEF